MGGLFDLITSPLIFGVSSGMLAFFLSPLQFLKILRQETGCSYIEICKKYYRKGGFWIFFRGWRPYCAMQFLSSAVFGVSHYLSDLIFLEYRGASMSIEVMIRSVLGAIFETTITIETEMREIASNKQEYMKSTARASSVVSAIFLRNTLFWVGGILAYCISSRTNAGYVVGASLAFIFGLLSGLLSIPLDAISTRNCGSDRRSSIIGGFITAYQRGGLSMLFSGASMRIFMIVCYTVESELVMMALKARF